MSLLVRCGVLVCAVCVADAGWAQTAPQIQAMQARFEVQNLKTLATNLKVKQTAARRAALDAGFKIRIERTVGDLSVAGPGAEGAKFLAVLQGLTEDGKPLYYRTFNVDAARSTRTNHLHQGGGLGLDLDGSDMIAYVWDGGAIRTTHVEFGTRASIGDNAAGYNGLGSDHATHVTGTMIAAGVDADARGMAPNATAIAFDWFFDTSEVATAASNGMLVSNHSYGFMVRDPNTGAPLLPPSYFGGYMPESRSWDEILHSSPFYLMVVAAGNEGLDDGANTDPLGPGFDKLTGHATSKNNLVVANARDVTTNDAGGIIGAVQITPSSSEGPTDDLRIKPDISGNGFEVKSTLHLGANGNSNNKYGQNGWTGTSMASPNVAGSLLLLQQLHQSRNDRFMKSATLKGLALHTADDAGNAGPDAIFGWGLLNVRGAAQAIVGHGTSSHISEETLTEAGGFTKKFKASGNVRVSISWTDPPGTANNVNTVNSSTPVLVNDLDLRLKNATTESTPWRLTGVSSNGRGDNRVDPFERIDVSSNALTDYEITVSHKQNLEGGSQGFSLIITADSLDLGVPLDSGNELNEIKQELQRMQQQIKSLIDRLERMTGGSQPNNAGPQNAAVPRPEYGLRPGIGTPDAAK